MASTVSHIGAAGILGGIFSLGFVLFYVFFFCLFLFSLCFWFGLFLGFFFFTFQVKLVLPMLVYGMFVDCKSKNLKSDCLEK